ncbi:hydrolase [Lithospermum erythrorhizon]|uniref:Hydrolase n=1 Tax=Lithospermum erythrorhizon TaxID=34254 RepID=A0AAV3Q8Z1_LITER
MQFVLVKSRFKFCTLLLVVSLSYICEAIVQLPPNVTVPAVIAFGDSLVDQGNNNGVITPAKATYLPYGKDLLINGKPTGRFSNGKTAMDFVAEELGIGELLPAYLDPNLKSSDLLTGVSFASGASGFDPVTNLLTPHVLSLDRQLELFKEYIGKLRSLVGEEKANFIVENSLYLVVSGNDDFIVNYFNYVTERKKLDVPTYANLLASYALDFVQEIYKLGARRIGVFAIAPIGCIPAVRTLKGGHQRSCSDPYNAGATFFNNKMATELPSLKAQLPGSKLVFIDIYSLLEVIIQKPQSFGFSYVDKGCCGTGYIEVAFLCNPTTSTCPDVDKHFFWDSFHPSQQGYKLLVQQILSKYKNQFF